MNVSANGRGLRVVGVDVDDVGDGVPVCTTAPRVEEPDDQCDVVPHSGPSPFSATTEKLSTDDYVARNNLILMAVWWPEIRERIVGETNRLLATGMPFSAVHCEVEKLVQAVEPEIRAAREERREQVRKGIVKPANACEREIAARARETDRLNAEADAAEIRAGIKKKLRRILAKSAIQRSESMATDCFVCLQNFSRWIRWMGFCRALDCHSGERFFFDGRCF